MDRYFHVLKPARPFFKILRYAIIGPEYMHLVKLIEQIDAEVGARIRLRRRVLGMSQSQLADRIGVTFQQVQKYEKGSNRVGSSRLQQIASALGVPPASLFGEGDAQSQEMERLDLDEMDELMTAEAVSLNRAFRKITNEKIRLSVIQLVEALSDIKR